MTANPATTQRRGPTPQQINEQQKKDTERDRQAKAARASPAAPPTSPAPTSTAVTTTAKPVLPTVPMPDARTPVQRSLDDVAPAAIVGRMIKFGKDGKFITADDGEAIGDDVDFAALCDQTLVGWLKFNGAGEPPDRVMGVLYDNFQMPERDTLGDDDQSKWELGLDGRPQDPWQHHVYLVLQRGDTQELFTYVTSSITGRRAIGNLLRHYDRMQRTHPDQYPVVRLKVGGFNHRDERVGWVSTPVLAVVGRVPKDSAAKPDSSPAADFADSIPF
jgi:hypothetical protein